MTPSSEHYHGPLAEANFIDGLGLHSTLGRRVGRERLLELYVETLDSRRRWPASFRPEDVARVREHAESALAMERDRAKDRRQAA